MKPQWTWIAVGAAATAAVFLLAGQSVSAVLPGLLLLACPVAMVFMMRGMGGMGTHHESSPPRERRSDQPK